MNNQSITALIRRGTIEEFNKSNVVLQRFELAVAHDNITSANFYYLGDGITSFKNLKPVSLDSIKAFSLYTDENKVALTVVLDYELAQKISEKEDRYLND